MKFKKDGKVFEGIWDARFAHCITVSVCKWCNVGANSAKDCINLCKDMPAEAARLMGYEVVEDESTAAIKSGKDESLEGNMDKPYFNDPVYEELFKDVEPKKETNEGKQKPLKDWTLGEVQEHCKAYREKAPDDETYEFCGNCCMARICAVLVDEWDLTEKPRFTQKEVEDARAVTRLEHPAWNTLVRKKDGTLWLNDKQGGWHAMKDNIFPSIPNGQSVNLSDIVGGNT